MKNVLLATALAVSAWTVSMDAEARRCRQCGVVEDVDRYVERERTSGGGAVLGAVVGGVLGSQVGSGSGRRAATVAGAVAGGIAGNNAEKRNARERVVWEFRVRMDNGHVRQVSQYSNPDRLRRGDRVRVRDGYVELL